MANAGVLGNITPTRSPGSTPARFSSVATRAAAASNSAKVTCRSSQRNAMRVGVTIFRCNEIGAQRGHEVPPGTAYWAVSSVIPDTSRHNVAANNSEPSLVLPPTSALPGHRVCRYGRGIENPRRPAWRNSRSARRRTRQAHAGPRAGTGKGDGGSALPRDRRVSRRQRRHEGSGRRKLCGECDLHLPLARGRRGCRCFARGAHRHRTRARRCAAAGGDDRLPDGFPIHVGGDPRHRPRRGTYPPTRSSMPPRGSSSLRKPSRRR